jgi:cell division protein ZapE
MTTPWQRYQADLQREDFSHDAAQEQAVLLLQDLFERLVASVPASEGGVTAWLRKLRGVPVEPQVGLYFWGGVGRGKTYLMDTFFECLPFARIVFR